MPTSSNRGSSSGNSNSGNSSTSSSSSNYTDGSASSGRLLGTAKLQQAIDKFTQAVQRLEQNAERAEHGTSPAGGGGSFASIGRMAQSIWTGKRPVSSNRWGSGRNGGGATFGGNPMPGDSDDGGNGNYRQSGRSFPGNTARTGNGGWQHDPSVAPPAGMSPNATWGAYSRGGPPGGNGGRQGYGSNYSMGGQQHATGLKAVVGGAIAYGNSKLPVQVGMDNYVMQTTIGQTGDRNKIAQGARFTAYGSHNKNLNYVANSGDDASAGMARVQQIVGAQKPQDIPTTQAGRNVLGAAQTYGYLNPAGGFDKAAKSAAQLYSGATSLNMMMHGYKTPLQAGGKKMSVSDISQNVLSVAYPTKSPGQVTQKELAAGLAPTGKLRANLKDIGVDADTYGPQIKAYASLKSKNYSNQQIDQLYKDAASGNKKQRDKATKTLENDGGVLRSDLQKMKNVDATKTGRDADVAKAFNKGLDKATSALEKFSRGLTNAFNAHGGLLGGIVGGGGGFASQFGRAAAGGGVSIATAYYTAKGVLGTGRAIRNIFRRGRGGNNPPGGGGEPGPGEPTPPAPRGGDGLPPAPERQPTTRFGGDGVPRAPGRQPTVPFGNPHVPHPNPHPSSPLDDPLRPTGPGGMAGSGANRASAMFTKLGEAISRMSRQAGPLGGVLEKIGGGFSKVSGILEKMTPWFEKISTAFGKVIPMFERIMPMLEKMGPWVSKAGPAIGKALPFLGKIFSHAAGGGVVPNAKNTAGDASNILNSVAKFAGGVSPVTSADGVAPGFNPGRDHIDAKVAPGEGLIVPEVVQAMGGPSAVRAANAKYAKGRQSSGNLFAGGDVVEAIKNELDPAPSKKDRPVAGVGASMQVRAHFAGGGIACGISEKCESVVAKARFAGGGTLSAATLMDAMPVTKAPDTDDSEERQTTIGGLYQVEKKEVKPSRMDRPVAGVGASAHVAAHFAGGGLMDAKVAPGEGILVPEVVDAMGGSKALQAANEKYAKGRQTVMPNKFPAGGTAGGTGAAAGAGSGGSAKAAAAPKANAALPSTDDANAKKFLDTARGEIGQGDKPGTENNNKYNAWYGLPQGSPWCDAFVSYVASHAGVAGQVGKFAATQSHADWFRSKKEWHSGTKGIRPGDVVFFNSPISHVGIVEKNNTGGGFGTIEGNHSHLVQRVSRSSGTGYGRPFSGSGGNGSAAGGGGANGAGGSNGTAAPAGAMDNTSGGSQYNVSGGGEGDAYGSTEEVQSLEAALTGSGRGGTSIAPSTASTSQSAGGSASGDAGGDGTLPHGKTSITTYGGPHDPGDNGHQASGIAHHNGSLSSPYWPMGTKVKLSRGGKSFTGTIEEFGPAAWAIAQHSPPAIIDVGYLTAAANFGDGVADFQVLSWGSGHHYSGAKKGGPGWDLAGDGHIPGWPGYKPAAAAAGGGSSGGSGGGDAISSKDTLSSVIRRGMAIAGVSGAAWENGLTTIAKHESGGDIHGSQVNNYDSNAKAGHPSAGLMQFIQSTFNSYKKPGYGTWMNPIDQVVADAWSGGYIQKRYHGISNVPGLKSLAAGHSYVGYADGAFEVKGDQWAMIHDKEMIIPKAPAESFRNSIMKEHMINPIATGRNLSGGSGGGITINVNNINVNGAAPGQTGREIVNEMARELEKKNMYDKIARGVKS